MKIFYIFSELTIKGGTDKVITSKANYLAEHGYDVTIITESQLGRPTTYPLSPQTKFIDIGINFNKQYAQKGIHRLITYYRYLSTYKKRLEQIINEQHPDIIITTMGRSLDFITTIKDDSIKIGEAHTTKYHLRSLHLLEEKGGVYKYIARYIRKKQIANAKRLSALVLLTPEDAKDWKDVTKTYVIPNSIASFPKESSYMVRRAAI